MTLRLKVFSIGDGFVVNYLSKNDVIPVDHLVPNSFELGILVEKLARKHELDNGKQLTQFQYKSDNMELFS